MKVAVIAGIHGDEVFGLKIVGELDQRSDQNVITMVAHAEAIAKRRRYVDQDLNRSFEVIGESKEARLAKSIKSKLRSMRPDFIIDIHTSVSDVSCVAIVPSIEPKIVVMAQALGVQAIVLMPCMLTRRSLIGQYPKTSLSLEFGRRYRSDKLAKEVAERITRCIPFKQLASDLEIYEVYATITKDYPGLSRINSLTFDKTLEGFPFLAGPTTYESIGGFLARKLGDQYQSKSQYVAIME
jgi:succinylglutamate desuccinylase